MSQGGQVFNRDVMFSFFHAVGEELARRDLVLEIAIYGGSAIMLQTSLFSNRRVTEDVDFIPLVPDQDGLLQSIMDSVTQEQGFEQRIFRDDIRMLISDQPDYNFVKQFPPETGNLRVFSASPAYLLAMKAMSMRSGFTSKDPVDFFHLSRELSISSLDDVLELVEAYFPGGEVPRPNQLNIADIIEYANRVGEEEPDEAEIRYLAR